MLVAWAFGGVIVFLASAAPFLPRYSSEVPWSGPVPAHDEWPGARRAGESAELASRGATLRVLAREAARAEALALEFSTRRARSLDPLRRAREAERARWRAASPIGPLPPLAPEAEAAAWLRAWLAVGQALTMHADSPTANVEPAANGSQAIAKEGTADETIAIADAAPMDPEAVYVELLSEIDRERAWLAERTRAGDRSMSAKWRGRWDARAIELEARAAALESSLTPFQQELVIAAEPERAFALAALVPTPEPAAAPRPSRASPLVALWLGVAIAGAAFGAWLGVALSRVRGRRAHAAVDVAGPPRAAATSDSWLHVVSGPSAGPIVRGAFDLCGCLVDRNHRVLLVECGRDLNLHVVVGGERRWGLMECLADHMPALGLVQEGGRRGLYVLTYGGRARSPRWPQLGRLLDEVRPHFGRIVLAIPAHAPRAIGDAFAGRVLDAWWSGRLGFRGAAKSLDQRLGIRFVPLQLEPEAEAPPELVETPVPLAAHALPGPPTLIPERELPKPVRVATPAAVLDCELRVRERLRFLLWMRRVRREEPEPAGSAPAR
jgi:hypothetical protein